MSNVELELDSRILGVDLVESIDKRLILCFDGTTNRWSAIGAFQNDTHRLDTTFTIGTINDLLNW